MPASASSASDSDKFKSFSDNKYLSCAKLFLPRQRGQTADGKFARIGTITALAANGLRKIALAGKRNAQRAVDEGFQLNYIPSREGGAS